MLEPRLHTFAFAEFAKYRSNAQLLKGSKIRYDHKNQLFLCVAAAFVVDASESGLCWPLTLARGSAASLLHHIMRQSAPLIKPSNGSFFPSFVFFFST